MDIIADSRAVKQMVINLLSNAIKFSFPDTKVILRCYKDEEIICIEVEDQGIGISQEDLPKLCNPFVQADSSYKREHEGVGLGLSVVKGLAQLHGGSFTISSQQGTWTKATIKLPLKAHKPDKSAITQEIESSLNDNNGSNERGEVIYINQKG